MSRPDLTFDEFMAQHRQEIAVRGIVEPVPPLVRGDRIAWTVRRGGVTAGVTLTHRYQGNDRTYCQELVPTNGRRLLDLTLAAPAPCKDCDTLHKHGADVAQSVKHIAALAVRSVA